jgi:hypothetical protein
VSHSRPFANLGFHSGPAPSRWPHPALAPAVTRQLMKAAVVSCSGSDKTACAPSHQGRALVTGGHHGPGNLRTDLCIPPKKRVR